MKKDILRKGIILPLIIGIVVAIAVFCALLGTDNFFPVNKQTAIAYFDNLRDKENKEENVGFFNLKNDQCIGVMNFGDDALNIIYKSNYTNMIDGVSMVDGSPFGKDGICYLTVLENSIQNLDNQKITVDSSFGKYTYKFVEKYEANNENDVKLKHIDTKKGIVLYYQKAEKYGFSSKYEALVYEEVQ